MKKLVIILMAVIIASCSSHKKIVDNQQNNVALTETKDASSPLVFPEWTIGSSVSAEARTVLNYNGNRFNLGGTLRMRRDDVIQLNLTYNAFVATLQIGTLEITGDRILLVDRMNSQYVDAPWNEVSLLAVKGVDFNLVQSVFWGETPDITTSQLSVTYGDYTILPDGHRLPSQVTLSAKLMNNKSLTIDVNLSDWRINDSWSTRTDVNNSRYTKVSVDNLLRKLSAL